MTEKLEKIWQSLEGAEPVINRRQFVKGGSTVAASTAFAALASNANAGHVPYSDDYGPLVVTPDEQTGLPLLALPEGFTYKSFGWTGYIQDDGLPTPTDHDGMAVVAARNQRIVMVRNHELSRGESSPSSPAYNKRGTYNPEQFGGCTNMVFDTRIGEFIASWNSQGGTIRNCAGGPTPWGTWITCEETFHAWNQPPSGQDTFTGYNHGYAFEVKGFGRTDARPIRGMGRFSHEACAVDVATGIIYQTEDARPSAFYKYVPNGKYGRLNPGELDGRLYAMVLDGIPRLDTNNSGAPQGTTWKVTWQEVPDPDAKEARCFDQAPDAAIISRGEGCWEDQGKIYFVSTDGGLASLGQIFCYDPRRETCTLLFESTDAVGQVDAPDNIAASPRGAILMCEDGGSNPKRLVGLTQGGATFPFAENRMELCYYDLDVINDSFPGARDYWWDTLPEDGSSRSFTSREWAGATFYGRWLFVNIQSPGVTFAITGPWENGAL